MSYYMYNCVLEKDDIKIFCLWVCIYKFCSIFYDFFIKIFHVHVSVYTQYRVLLLKAFIKCIPAF